MINFVKELNLEINQKNYFIKIYLEPKIKYIKIKIIDHQIVCLINNLKLISIAEEFIKNNKLKIFKIYENDLKKIKYDEEFLD